MNDFRGNDPSGVAIRKRPNSGRSFMGAISMDKTPKRNSFAKGGIFSRIKHHYVKKAVVNGARVHFIDENWIS